MLNEPMYRYTITFDLGAADRFAASRKITAIQETVGKIDGDVQIDELEWLGLDDEPPIHCWCGEEATYINPPPDGFVWEPVCDSHVKDGYEELPEDDVDSKLELS